MTHDIMAVTAENSTLSCTLSSALSIKTPRKVLQTFVPGDSDCLVSVISTQEANARVASMKFAQEDLKVAGDVHTSDVQSVPRFFPQQLEVVLPSEQDPATIEYAVLTPQVCHIPPEFCFHIVQLDWYWDAFCAD
jgi:hypothetical protein